ncbi:MAG TPA: TIGR00303 family protein [Methanoculleus sp.]|nr:TIGR00303 family protein [Methanoculleus sp.]
MAFLSEPPSFSCSRPILSIILGNTMLSTVPGISGAGPSPEKTLSTPILDAELVAHGAITSMADTPNTPTGCPTPATITRSMVELTGLVPLFINAGLKYAPTVPCLDVYGAPGEDPRHGEAVPGATALFERGRYIGSLYNTLGDLLVLGECVPGGTTTALCVLRALGYDARVSSSFVDNPHTLKEEVADMALRRIRFDGVSDPLAIIRSTGDPMMAVAAGIATAYTGTLVLAGGTQMLAVAAVLKSMGEPLPPLVTTVYLRDDPSASFAATVAEVGTTAMYVDPGFGDLGHGGLARYCIGEVKEGTGAGGAMLLARLMGHSPDAITGSILRFVSSYG